MTQQAQPGPTRPGTRAGAGTRRRRRSLAAVLAAGTAGVLLAACSSSGGSSGTGTGNGGSGSGGSSSCSPSKGKVTLTFSTWVPGMDKVVALWNQQNPNIQVKVNSVPAGNSGTYQNFGNALKAGTAPDLGQIEYDTLPNFRLQNGLKNIAPCPGVAAAQSKFVPWTWSQVDFNSNDGVFAIPQDTGPMALFYRKDVFDKLGLKAPTTWAEYAQDAAKIHQANPKQYITFFSQSDPNWYTGLLWQNGAQLFSTTNNAVKVDIGNNPKVTQVDKYWQDLIDKKLIATNLQGFSPELYKAWSDGSVVSWISAAWGYSTIRDNAKNTSGDWAVAPMPQWSAGQSAAGNWGGSSTAVFATSKHPAEAAKFALWLNTDPKALTMENALGGLYPAAKQGLDIPSLQQGVPFYGGEKIFDVFKQASAGVNDQFEWGPTMTDTYSALKDGIVAALSGNGTLEQATTQTQQKTIASLQAQNVPIAK